MLIETLKTASIVAPFIMAIAAMLWLRGFARVAALIAGMFIGWVLLVQAAVATENAYTSQTGYPGCGMLSGLTLLFGPVFSGGSVVVGAITGLIVKYSFSLVKRFGLPLGN